MNMKKHSLTDGGCAIVFAMVPLYIIHILSLLITERSGILIGVVAALLGTGWMLFTGLAIAFFICVPVYSVLAFFGWTSWSIVILVGGIVGSSVGFLINSDGYTAISGIAFAFLGVYFGAAFKYGAENLNLE